MERIKLSLKWLLASGVFDAVIALAILIYIYGNKLLISNLFVVFGIYALGTLNKRKMISITEQKDRMHVTILSVLLSFALIGNYLFCYPLVKNTSFIDVILFLLFAYCITPVTSTLIWLEKDISEKDILEKKRSVDKKHFIKMRVLYIFLTEIVGIIMLCAFNPAIVSWDAYEVLAEAYGLSPLLEYTGLMYVGIFSLLLRICNSVMFLGIVQITLFAILFSRIFIWVEKRSNLKTNILIIVYLIVP